MKLSNVRKYSHMYVFYHGDDHIDYCLWCESNKHVFVNVLELIIFYCVIIIQEENNNLGQVRINMI